MAVAKLPAALAAHQTHALAGAPRSIHRLELANRAPLPPHGPALLVSNHTSGIDYFVIQAGCRRVLGFLVVQEFYDWYESLLDA